METGTYIALKMEYFSRNNLFDFLEKYLPKMKLVDRETYHLTIAYSKNPIEDADFFKGGIGYRAVALPKCYTLFSTSGEKPCLVIELEFEWAVKFHNILKKLGASYEYDEYKPHVTICYEYEGDPEEIKSLEIPKFYLFFDKVVVEPLNEDYIPPNEK